MFVEKIIKTFLSALIVAAPALAFAQSASFSLNVSPASPAPGETVFVNLTSSQFNADLAKISWKVDGKAKDSGVGKKSISLLAPANGKTTEVTATVVVDNALPIEQSVKISSGEMDLIWESVDGYTPPFYRGKTLPINQSQVRVVAIPNVKTSTGATVPAKNFAYNWQKDGASQGGQSGYGKSSMNFTNQNLETTNRIEVSATDGTKSLKGSMIVSYFQPEILIYRFSEALGIESQKILKDSDTVKQGGLIVKAEPYFLSRNFKTDTSIKGIWKLNGEEVNAPLKDTLAINATSITGSLKVYFKYDDTKKLFRDFEKSINLNISK